MNRSTPKAWMLSLLCQSWRKDYRGLAQLDERLVRGEKMILVFWHGKYLALLPLLKNRKACVFTSLSARGNTISDLLEYFGYEPVQLKDGGGVDSLNLMRDALQQFNTAAVAIDGPLGPFHHVHHGAIRLASECRYQLVPASVAARPISVLSSRWDKFEAPWPFAKVCIAIGEPMQVPERLSETDKVQWQERVHAELERLGTYAGQQVSGKQGSARTEREGVK